MEMLSKDQLMEINGGGSGKVVVKFVKDYVIGKAVDWAVDHRKDLVRPPSSSMRNSWYVKSRGLR